MTNRFASVPVGAHIVGTAELTAQAGLRPDSAGKTPRPGAGSPKSSFHRSAGGLLRQAEVLASLQNPSCFVGSPPSIAQTEDGFICHNNEWTRQK